MVNVGIGLWVFGELLGTSKYAGYWIFIAYIIGVVILEVVLHLFLLELLLLQRIDCSSSRL